MLQTIKQRVLNSIPPTVLFLVLFFSILYICGLQDALIATFLTLEFMRLKTDEFVESTMIKSTVLYIIIAVFAYLAGLNVYLCAVFNFVTPFMIIYLFLDEFDPTNQIPYTLALAFFQLIPTDLRGLPIRIGAIVGACIVTYIAVILTRLATKKQPNKNIQILTVQGLQEMVCQLDAVIQKDFDRVKQHQDKLFEINRSLSHSIYGANDNLVLNGSSGQSYFPFIIVFQHMNHLMGDICDKPKVLTQDTILYLEKLRDVLNQAQKLAAKNQMKQASLKLIEFSGEIEIDQIDINYNIVYILNYLSTAFMEISNKRKGFSFKNIQFKSHIWYQIKANFNIHSFKMRFALRLSIAVCPVATLMYYFNLPHGFWMPMTILVLILPYWENTLRKIADRVIGTLLGIAVFAILYYFFPSPLEQMIIMVIVNFLIYTTKRYAFTAIFLTCSSFAINVAMNNADHLFSLRFIYTIGAAIIAIVASYCIFPTNNEAELKNMMRRLLDMDDFLLDTLLQLSKGNQKQSIKQELVLTSYLVSGKIENHCIMSKSSKNKVYVKRCIMLNNKFVTDIAHIYTLMSMQQKERIDPEALTSLIMDLKATIKSMKDMLSHKKVVVSHPKLDYNQVYDDVYVNGKMIRSADCLYRMYDCVQTHLLN